MVDYRGQLLGERIYYFLTIAFGAVGWLVGFKEKDFYVTFQGWLAGLVLALLICIPDWPFFNSHPVQWLDEIPLRDAAGNTIVSNKKSKKSKKSD